MIVVAALLQLTLAVAILYYTPYQLLLVPIVLVANYLLYTRLLVSKKRSYILAKMLRPSLWLLLFFGYLFSIHVLFLVPIAYFVLLSVLTTIGYILLVSEDVSESPSILLDTIFSISLLLFGISLASLMLAYWHWPAAIVLLGVWLVSFFIALLWLLDFTESPQLLASVWALICVELFWITSRWVHLYQIPKTMLLLSQAAIVICALAYGFGGIYFHFKKKTLRKSLIFEYIGVTTVIFVALMLLSRWAVAV